MIAWILGCVFVWAFSSLACSMSKHQRDIFTAKVSAQKNRLFQLLGWGILIFSALLVIFLKGASIGLSEWVGSLTFAALIVGLTLSYFPKKLRQLNIAASVLLVICLIIALI